MKKKIPITILAVIIAFSLCACSTNNGYKQTEDTAAAPKQSTEPDEIHIVPEAPMPMVMVNDLLYQSYDYGSHLAQKLDNSWNLIGKIESISETKQPTENLQANFAIAGASVYHSSTGCFTVNPYGNDFLVTDKEYFGNGIIVDYEGEYYQLIAEDEVSEVAKLRDEMSDYGQLLRVDGVTYLLRSKASGGNFKLDNNYVYLGEVISVVSEDERPTEDFQTNSLLVGVGSEIYKLPSDDISGNDLVVICGSNRYEYKNMG